MIRLAIYRLTPVAKQSGQCALALKVELLLIKSATVSRLSYSNKRIELKNI